MSDDSHGELGLSGIGQGASNTKTRRQFLAASGVAAVGSVGGCLGGGSSMKSSGNDPKPPWTTEELAKQVDDGSTITIYAGTGDAQQWYDLVKVINDEFGTNIKANVFASDGAAVSQRFIQERQAGEDKVDVVSVASDLRDRIKKIGVNKGKEKALDYARKWYEWNMGENFWFKDVLPKKRMLPWMVSGFNGGAGLVMPVSKQIFEKKGLEYPNSYNDLFKDQYEGLSVAFSGYVSPGMIGWITRYHAKQTDMGRMEWIKSLMDRFEVVGVSSHSAGTREVGKGNVAMMLYNWPWAAAPFIKNEKLDVKGVFTDPVKSNAMEGGLMINKKAPNPWLARYFVSAVLEKPVQRRMLTDVTDQIPVRTDIDLSGVDIHPYTRRRLNANLFTIGFWESAKYNETGRKAIETGIFKP